ncbi:MAG: hypothetical protein J5794_04340 [Lachnospiraceae bacterium]|nr:hypothetical protein [Lachnospiraceae bacterium]
MKNLTGKFLAGYAVKDITPDGPIPIGGFGRSWMRISKQVLDPLIVQCAAMTDADGEVLMLFTYDNCTMRNEIYERTQHYFEDKYGVDSAHFHINYSHSESSPDTVTDREKFPEIGAYIELVIRQIIAAGEEALADRKPALLEYGTTHTHNLNFVKHAFLDTGVAIGDNHGRSTDGRILQHTSKVDDAMLAIKILRENEPDIVLVNWRAHNQFTSGFYKYDISSDYVGAFRDAAKEKFGCNLMFFQGCAGNVNPYSYIRDEEITRDYKLFGKLLTNHLYDIYYKMTPIEAGKIRAEQVTVQTKANHSEDHKLEAAKHVVEFWNTGAEMNLVREESKKYGFSSPFHASSVIRRFNLPETIEYPVSVYSIGDLAFASVKFEIFDNLGVFVRENSPFAHTFVMGYTDHAATYMASAYAYEYGCYEAENTHLSIGSGERCAAIMLERLIHMKYHYGE